MNNLPINNLSPLTIARMFMFGCKCKGDIGQAIIYHAGIAISLYTKHSTSLEEHIQSEIASHYSYALSYAKSAVRHKQFKPFHSPYSLK